jgi:hypothetical protein
MNVNTSFGKSERLSRPQPPEREWSNASHLAAIDEEQVAAEGGVGGVDENESSDDGSEKKEEPVTWMSLPHRTQLIILTLARLSEPLVQTSLQVKLPRHRCLISFCDFADKLQWQSYMFYQLKSFDESLPDSTIAAQAGMMASSFTGAQFLTAMMWGRISDSDKGGRKLVLLIGLLGTSEFGNFEVDVEY